MHWGSAGAEAGRSGGDHDGSTVVAVSWKCLIFLDLAGRI